MIKRNKDKPENNQKEIDELLQILRNHKDHIERLEEKVKKIEKNLSFASPIGQK